MDYAPRPGIVMLTICGKHVLVPSREASDACKSVFPLNFLSYIIWTGIENNKSPEEVISFCKVFVKKPDQEIAAGIKKICEKLVERGFAIQKDGSEAPAAQNEAESSLGLH